MTRCLCQVYDRKAGVIRPCGGAVRTVVAGRPLCAPHASAQACRARQDLAARGWPDLPFSPDEWSALRAIIEAGPAVVYWPAIGRAVWGPDVNRAYAYDMVRKIVARIREILLLVYGAEAAEVIGTRYGQGYYWQTDLARRFLPEPGRAAA